MVYKTDFIIITYSCSKAVPTGDSCRNDSFHTSDFHLAENLTVLILPF